MNGIAADLTDEEIEQAAEWYAHLPAGSWIRVVTCERVPSSYVNKGRMRIPHSIDGLAYEPLGNRIVELPENSHRAVARDPRSGFVAYVPSGAIERGRDLIEHVPREHACAACHGERLQGASDVPRLAGLSALYVTRQLVGFRNGERREPRSEQMAIVVAEMTPDEMLAISAYLASLNPTQAEGNTATETVTPRDERRPCD
jgi:cytochrome c553